MKMRWNGEDGGASTDQPGDCGSVRLQHELERRADTSSLFSRSGLGFSVNWRQRETRPRPGERSQREAESEGKKTSRGKTKRQEEHQTAEQAAMGKFVARVAAGQPTANFAGAMAERQVVHDDTGGADSTLRASGNIGI